MPSEIATPPGGGAKIAHGGTFALVPSGDFGEIIDTVSAAWRRCKEPHKGTFALVPNGDFGEITDTVSAAWRRCKDRS